MCNTGICKHEIQNGPDAGDCSLPFGAELDCPEELDDFQPICLLCGNYCIECADGRWWHCGYFDEDVLRLFLVRDTALKSIKHTEYAVKFLSNVQMECEWCYFEDCGDGEYYTDKSGFYTKESLQKIISKEYADELFANYVIVDLSLIECKGDYNYG